MENPNNKKFFATIYLSSSFSLSLSSCKLEWVWVCINKGGHLPIYTLQVINLPTWLGRPLTLTGPTSPRETPKVHYIILYWGLLLRLTTEVVPQGLCTIMTSQMEGNASPMRVQQHTMVIYIGISSEVTNTTTLRSSHRITITVHKCSHTQDSGVHIESPSLSIGV